MNSSDWLKKNFWKEYWAEVFEWKKETEPSQSSGDVSWKWLHDLDKRLTPPKLGIILPNWFCKGFRCFHVTTRNRSS